MSAVNEGDFHTHKQEHPRTEHFLRGPSTHVYNLAQSDHIVGNSLALRDYPTSSPTHLRIIHWIRDDAQQLLRHIPESITSSSLKCTCCNTSSSPNSVSVIFSMSDVFIHIYERIVNEAHDWNYFFLLSLKRSSSSSEWISNELKRKELVSRAYGYW